VALELGLDGPIIVINRLTLKEDKKEDLKKIMNRNRLNMLPIIATAALALSGCGGGEKAGSNIAETTTTSNANMASRVSPADGGANVAPANSAAAVAPSQTTAGGGGIAPSPQQPQAASQGSGARRAGNAPPANMPTPQIGSGGNDFYLFTQARAALNADAELKAANIIVDIRQGVATLSGEVKSSEQKSKAEQLVQAAGLKTVKNQLRVSTGK
jgi:osmotically-inducible protein OsmY